MARGSGSGNVSEDGDRQSGDTTKSRVDGIRVHIDITRGGER
jgi:hypothetical protein